VEVHVRKAYRIKGSSFTKPENLPEGFEVRERMVGDTVNLRNGVCLQEAKDGSVVMYRKGESGSNVKLSRDDQFVIMVFLNRVINSHIVPLD
jgi:hypothetical protein